MVKFLKQVKEYVTVPFNYGGGVLSTIEDFTHMMLISCKKAYYLADLCEIWVLYNDDSVGIFEGSSMIFVTKEEFSGKVSEYNFDEDYINEMNEEYGKLKE